MNVPKVKAKETKPMIPETKKKGEVAVVDTTTPMAVRYNQPCEVGSDFQVFVGDHGHDATLGAECVRNIVHSMLGTHQDEVNNGR
jgi:hypothetical protein